MTEFEGQRIMSVIKAIRVIEAVLESPQPLTARAIADRTGLNVSTCHHLIRTLISEDLLQSVNGKYYSTGPRVGRWGVLYIERHPIREIIHQQLQYIASTTGETTYLARWGDEMVVIVDMVLGTNSLRVSGLGVGPSHSPHARASGKLLLALSKRDEQVLDFIASHPLLPVGPHTIVDTGRFLEEMHRIREQAAAFDHEEYAAGVHCISVPVVIGDTTFALSVSYPSVRHDLQSPYLRILREAAEGIQRVARDATY